MNRALFSLPIALLFATAGCNPSNNCQRRPWECSAAATETGGASATGGDVGGGSGVGGGGGGDTQSGTCSSYVPPPYSALPTNPKLPDPFMQADGTRMTSQDQWQCRRTEIKAQAQKYELGPNPGAPASVTGSFDGSGNNINVTASDGTKSITFAAKVTYPTTGDPPYPAMIGIDGINIDAAGLNALGVATIIFPASTVAQQKDASSRGLGLFYQLYSGSQAGAMMAWAWGVGRLIDVIEKLPEADIDPTRLGVTGCSRDGKGALIVGAFEDRIALTIPVESGSGGSASWRISDAMFAAGAQVQTLSEITQENVWFTPSFQFNNSATKLPFDHHMIEGLVAPRALLVIENTSQIWLGNVSTYNDSMAAHLIWEALGIPDKMGVSQKDHPDHCGWNGSQQPEVTAYVQKFLIGTDTSDAGAINTNVLKTDGSYSFDKATWVDWTVPTL